MDWLQLATWPTRPFTRRCRVPADLASVLDVGAETPGREVGISRGALQRVWQSVENLYRTGLYPALQLCVRYRGAVVLERALGHASGNEPGAGGRVPRVPVKVDTPFRIYSASKAITAMVIHQLDDRGALHIDDRICDYLPEFTRGRKSQITLTHVLSHRAGIPNIPPAAMDLDLLASLDDIIELLADAPLVARPGRRLAYHAITGGFVLGAVVQRATGQDIGAALAKEICEPLDLDLGYGIAPERIDSVARDVITGIPPLPPMSKLLERALGAPVADVVDLAHDPRFLTSIVPAANVVTTARSLSAFYDCLRNDGELGGVRVFEPRTVRRATGETSYWELDLTLGAPIRYGLGFMLGGPISLFGPDTHHAFGHLGFTNVWSWADPQRELSLALLTSGKPFLNLEVVRLLQFLSAVNREFPKVDG